METLKKFVKSIVGRKTFSELRFQVETRKKLDAHFREIREEITKYNKYICSSNNFSKQKKEELKHDMKDFMKRIDNAGNRQNFNMASAIIAECRKDILVIILDICEDNRHDAFERRDDHMNYDDLIESGDRLILESNSVKTKEFLDKYLKFILTSHQIPA